MALAKKVRQASVIVVPNRAMEAQSAVYQAAEGPPPPSHFQGREAQSFSGKTGQPTM
jgi:hypothetical protein